MSGFKGCHVAKSQPVWIEIAQYSLSPAQDVLWPLKTNLARLLKIDEENVLYLEIIKRSIDARKKGNPFIHYHVALLLHKMPQKIPHTLKVRTHVHFKTKDLNLPVLPSHKKQAKIVIVGAGPAGVFAALKLMQAGFCPILIDRGKPVETRAQDVQKLKRYRILNEESNFCYGEGGAGTWSDGKLTTRIGDPRVDYVFQSIVSLGGPNEILYEGKPHLGTNRLVKFLRALRTYLLANGVQMLFEQRVDSLVIKDARVTGVRLQSGSIVDAEHVILAPGHSARDVYRFLHEQHIALEPKPFAMGFRIEHPQALINEIQYGRGEHLNYLPAADYRLTHNLEINQQARGVYSFCMCPGGVIVPTANEPDGLCINGMSHASRSSPYANSALVVSVHPEDYMDDTKHPLLGVLYQRRFERAAFELAGSSFRAPAQRVSEFVAGQKKASDIEKTSYLPGVVPSDLLSIYPDWMNQAFGVALKRFDRIMPGYLSWDAYLLGVETRTSSPVRILRQSNLQSPSCQGLYPVGEGAGYAGGIVSAAVDGVRAAEAIINLYAHSF